MKKYLLFLITVMVIVAGCTQQEQSSPGQPLPAAEPGADVIQDEPVGDSSPGGWKNTPLKDVNTGKTFRISDFQGKPILLESFAVWCPTCKKQQDEIKRLHEKVGDSVVSIALDTDPNEDESKVKEHLERHGYDWYYAVSPVDVTKALIDEFGVTVVNAPGAPVVLICTDQSSRLLPRGVKDVSDLEAEIAKGC